MVGRRLFRDLSIAPSAASAGTSRRRLPSCAALCSVFAARPEEPIGVELLAYVAFNLIEKVIDRLERLP